MSYIVAPVISQPIEVRIIERTVEDFWRIIVVSSVAMKKIVTPLSLVCGLSLLVEKLPVATDQVVLETPLIEGPSGEHNFSLTLHFAVLNLS